MSELDSRLSDGSYVLHSTQHMHVACNHSSWLWSPGQGFDFGQFDKCDPCRCSFGVELFPGTVRDGKIQPAFGAFNCLPEKLRLLPGAARQGSPRGPACGVKFCQICILTSGREAETRRGRCKQPKSPVLSLTESCQTRGA